MKQKFRIINVHLKQIIFGKNMTISFSFGEIFKVSSDTVCEIYNLGFVFVVQVAWYLTSEFT